ncbi:MAG: MBL fold metallo-hydrolase [Bacteroidales bacterium]|nr:MBL fold metallo-hydrolase [Bacteroidales bacterium]
MEIINFRFNDLQVNTFIVIDTDTKQCVIIDPGCYSNQECDFLVNYISKNKLSPKFVINTHCHSDHILGVKFITDYYKIPFLANINDQYLLDSAEKFAYRFDWNVKLPIIINQPTKDGDIIKFGNSELKILHTPGHTPGQQAIYSDKEKFMIVGDTIFKGTIGRTDLPGGDLDQLMDSIKNKILTFDPDFTIFPGHGESTKVSIEMTENPFFNLFGEEKFDIE